MRQVVLEGRELSSQAALHDALAELFGFPPFYGRNWDALWDVLEDSDLNNVLAPTELVWRDSSVFERADPDGFATAQRIFAETSCPVTLRLS
jgi:ribonuclease inhibitor